MEDPGWDRIEELFHEAAELAPKERPAFLDRVCGGDPLLRREVESLLAADAQHSQVFREVMNRAFEDLRLEPEQAAALVGRRIGPYAVRRLIGSGGMGAVYHAVREDDFRMDVAIKVLQPGAESALLLNRFRAERQMLAKLDHPHIVRLLDGGATEGGLPYLVMEYVEGEPLLEYGSRLPVRKRVELFRAVCSAVQYAHQRNIVHRDIKPANILVTTSGVVKLLDFGIAKLVDRSSNPTVTSVGSRPMTPAYASPEQRRGEPVTAASDIYSLGAVLRELLSAGTQVLDPDLERITGKATQQEPGQRYASAEDLSEDLGRFLDGKPVAAHPENVFYRGHKFLHRNRWTVAVGLVSAALALILWTAVYRVRAPGRSREASQSIAVLPLENLSGDPEQDYFAEGMTDALITELAGVAGLRVIARTSVLAYKGVHGHLEEIARSLRVGSIAEGSVLRAGGRIRITLRLLEGGSGRAVWGGSYEGDSSDILALQSRAAAAIVHGIRARTPGKTRAPGPAGPPFNPAAYDAYLKGRHALYQSTVTHIHQGIRHFQSALEIEPRYAPAYAGLAESYIVLSSMYLRPREAMPKARAAALEALKLDPNLGDAHFSLGVVRGWYEFSWEQAREEFKRALAINPNSAFAHAWYGHSLVACGRTEEGIASIQTAHDIDPLSAFLETGLGQAYFLSRQYEPAIRQLRSVTEADPNFMEGHAWLGAALLYGKRYAEAVAELKRARELDPRQPQPAAYLAVAYAKLGDRAAAARLRQELVTLSQARYISPYLFAIVSAGTGAGDSMDWLERAYDERDDMLAWIKTDAIMDPLRGEPRFARLMQEVGFGPGTPSPSPRQSR